MVERFVPLNQAEEFAAFCKERGLEPSKEAARAFLFSRKETERSEAEKIYDRVASAINLCDVKAVEIDYERMRLVIMLSDSKRQVRFRNRQLMDETASLICKAVLGSRLKGAACKT